MIPSECLEETAAGRKRSAGVDPQRRWLARVRQFANSPWLAGAFFVYAALVLARGQFSPEGPLERDGYFHARLSSMFFERGLSRDFPWTQVSTWRERFCDKEFLFHALMAPFARAFEAEPIHGALLFCVILELGFLLAFFLVLRANQAPVPLFFAWLLLGAGSDFLLRLTMVRSHILSMLLLLLGMHLLLRRKPTGLAILGFVYAWSYTFPFVLAMSAAAFIAAAWLAGGRFDWKLPLAAALGSLAGLLIHPYSPLTFESITTVLRIGSIGSGEAAVAFPLGNEFYPRSTRWLLTEYPLVVLLGVALVWAGWATRRTIASDTAGVVGAALAWGGMMLVYPRFAEYLVPLLVMASALVARDVLAGRSLVDLLGECHGRRLMGFLAACVLGSCVLHSWTISDFYKKRFLADPPRFRGAAAWMADHLQPCEKVVNIAWDDFPDLFYDGHRQRYLWGIDPTFSLVEDPKRAKLLSALRYGRRVVDPKEVSKEFDARYLIFSPKHFVLRTDGWQPVYQDEFAQIFALQ